MTATARDIASLGDLVAEYGAAILPIPLDVTDRAAVLAAVHQAHETFGRLDVVVNNAGYGQFGMVEEISEPEIRAQLERIRDRLGGPVRQARHRAARVRAGRAGLRSARLDAPNASYGTLKSTLSAPNASFGA